MLRNPVASVHAYTAEMKKDERRCPVDHPRGFFLFEHPLMDIPVGDVASDMLQHANGIKITGNQVDPFLIDEQSTPAFVISEGQTAFFPPIEEAFRLGGLGDCDKAQIENAIYQQQRLSVGSALVRRGGMRRQDNRIACQCFVYGVERRTDQDIWIEIYDLVDTIPENFFEKRRFNVGI